MKKSNKKFIEGNIVLIEKEMISPGRIIIENDKISKIIFDKNIKTTQHIIPGLIDAHVHIESSMVTPEEFSKAVVKHGTVSVITDPHEITNVLGKEGFNFMINNSKKGKIKTFFGVPSCVPATPFETSGAIINHKDIKELMNNPQVVVLSEMMNFPGVIYEDEEVLKKIKVSKEKGLPIDGHAPGLKGDNLIKYITAGISTDHEATSFEEGEEKIRKGMKILIREGSAARNFEALYPLIEKYPDKVMLCTDDSHPDEIIKEGHIDKIIKKGIKKGINIFKLLKVASLNAIEHYNLPVGKLKEGDFADFVIIDNLKKFNIIETYINGEKTINNKTDEEEKETTEINVFNRKEINIKDIIIKSKNETEELNVIKCFDGELLTKKEIIKIKTKDGKIEADVNNDILKLVVVNRYNNKTKPAIGFIKGFGLKKGALASTVAHDSHNIIAVGCDDEQIIKAINEIIKIRGGIIAIDEKNNKEKLPLPIAGLMSNKTITFVAEKYEKLNSFAKKLGSSMKAPFMTLSFMALPVIPEIKLSDKGLFDTNKFEFMKLTNEKE